MGLRETIARAAVSRAHVLIAEAPGAFPQRVALERALDAAGWRPAETAADADVLAVVGEPGPALTELIDRAWDQLSEPRVRIEVREEGDVGSALAQAREALQDTAAQRAGALRRHEHEHEDEGHDGGGEHGGGHHEGHEGMAPDGIPLAEGAEDRDGLEMDELHLPWGPVLAHWPAGVVLRLTLHGDLVTDAELEHLGGAESEAEEDGATRAARLLDAAASVLVLAGLPAEAARARRLRDRCLDGTPPAGEDLARLATRLRRHRVLRWLLGGLVLPGAVGGDADLHDRLVGLVERAREAAAHHSAPAHRAGPAGEVLPELIRGQELAAVRLWMAATRADLTTAVPGEVPHG